MKTLSYFRHYKAPARRPADVPAPVPERVLDMIAPVVPVSERSPEDSEEYINTLIKNYHVAG